MKIKILIVVFVLFVLWTAWGYFGSNVEQLKYTVVKEMDGYEIREYPTHIIAQTTVEGNFGSSMSSGFSIVAGYIFGGNTKNESIAMTAPVIAQKESVKKNENIAMTAPVVSTSNGDTQTISFSMPSSYTLETLPTPNDPRVKIVQVPTKKFAVIRFSGLRSSEKVKAMQQKLLSALAKDGIVPVGNISYAGYNGPWTPPWMNRNEVLVEIK